MNDIIINVGDWFHHLGHHHLTAYPVFGIVREQSGPVTPTLNYKGRLYGVMHMADFTMTDSQQTTLSLKYQDKKGNPAPAPAGVTVTFLVDNPAMLALTPSADGSSCLVAAVGPLGTATVSVKAADTTGTTIAAGTLSIEVDGGNATNIVINPSPAVEQP